MTESVRRIVFTGADVSGKSSAWEALRQEFADVVIAVPEAATILIRDLGCDPPFLGERGVRFQQAVAGKTIILEQAATRLLNNEKKLLLCDRGLGDHIAYLGGEEAMERHLGISAADARARYEAVLFFDPPTEDVFNAHRMGNARIARPYAEVLRIHEETLDAWKGHPRIFRVPSFPTWEEKLAVARGHLRALLDHKAS